MRLWTLALLLGGCPQATDTTDPDPGGDTEVGTAVGTEADTSAGTEADTSAGTEADTSAGTEADTSAGTEADTDPDTSVAQVMADFSLMDVNPTSSTYDQAVSPRDYLQKVSGWYFLHST